MKKLKEVPAKKAAKKSISVHSVLQNTYKTIPLDDEWVPFIGLPSENFRMIVYGESGSGKTSFVMRLCVALTKLGKVYYNSSEEGEGKSIQDSLKRANVAQCVKGSFMLGDRDSFEDVVEKLSQKRSAPFCVLDSLQYMELTEAQVKQLVATFPRKAFIIISWSSGPTPKGKIAKAVEYMADIKTYVHNGTAISRSRFGATLPFEVYPPRETEVKPKGRPAKARVEQPELELQTAGDED